MQRMPEFVREDGEREEGAVRLAASASLTGWETVIFQVAEDSDSDSATAAFAP